MNKTGKILIVAVLVAAVGLVILAKQINSASQPQAAKDSGQVSDASWQGSVQQSQALPRLVDLGAGKCIPCKMMAPILEELKNEYADSMKVDVFDIEKNPDMLDKYRVRVIPTQIFFDASGKELFRHEGFMAKNDILAKWAELGVELTRTK